MIDLDIKDLEQLKEFVKFKRENSDKIKLKKINLKGVHILVYEKC